MTTSGMIYWITGLPASGKTTLARALVAALTASGGNAFLLDGDELRQGLCSDLGMSPVDRSENIRRAGEVARLLSNAGITVVCSFVSPYAVDRKRVRTLFPAGKFIEIYLSTAPEECVRRDPKGLYARARARESQGITGWDAPYEPPEAPEFKFDTQILNVLQMINMLDLNQ